MRLLNGDRAIILIEKLKGYCLNAEHPSGKHKARVFASALGITSSNAGDLQKLIARAAVEGEVVQKAHTNFGQLWKVDWSVPNRDQLVLRTLWETTSTSSTPRLISAFIK